MLNPELESQIREHAIAQHKRSREACGLIINGQAIAVENTADHPDRDFRIDAVHLAQPFDAIWHSHINHNESLSPDDILACLQLNVPFILYLVKSNKLKVYDPRPNSDYLGRPPCPGINDCWSLVDHWYRFELGVELPRFDRQELIIKGWDALNDPNWNRFIENIDNAGFTRVSLESPLEIGDVLLFQNGSPTVSHAGVLIDADDLYFMHQLMHRPSRIDQLTGAWRGNLMAVARLTKN